MEFARDLWAGNGASSRVRTRSMGARSYRPPPSRPPCSLALTPAGAHPSEARCAQRGLLARLTMCYNCRPITIHMREARDRRAGLVASQHTFWRQTRRPLAVERHARPAAQPSGRGGAAAARGSERPSAAIGTARPTLCFSAWFESAASQVASDHALGRCGSRAWWARHGHRELSRSGSRVRLRANTRGSY